jgi:hypothetical protein
MEMFSWSHKICCEDTTYLPMQQKLKKTSPTTNPFSNAIIKEIFKNSLVQISSQPNFFLFSGSQMDVKDASNRLQLLQDNYRTIPWPLPIEIISAFRMLMDPGVIFFRHHQSFLVVSGPTAAVRDAALKILSKYDESKREINFTLSIETIRQILGESRFNAFATPHQVLKNKFWLVGDEAFEASELLCDFETNKRKIYCPHQIMETLQPTLIDVRVFPSHSNMWWLLGSTEDAVNNADSAIQNHLTPTLYTSVERINAIISIQVPAFPNVTEKYQIRLTMIDPNPFTFIKYLNSTVKTNQFQWNHTISTDLDAFCEKYFNFSDVSSLQKFLGSKRSEVQLLNQLKSIKVPILGPRTLGPTTAKANSPRFCYTIALSDHPILSHTDPNLCLSKWSISFSSVLKKPTNKIPYVKFNVELKVSTPNQIEFVYRDGSKGTYPRLTFAIDYHLSHKKNSSNFSYSSCDNFFNHSPITPFYRGLDLFRDQMWDFEQRSPGFIQGSIA